MANQKQNSPKPDDRSNNVERIDQMIKNTKENIQKAEISMEFSSPEEVQKMQEKNKRREQSINAMVEERNDEAQDRENGYK